MYENFDPLNNPIDALRLEFGDVDEYDFILSNESYQYLIDKYGTSQRRLRTMVGQTILAQFARDGFRQRVGQEDAYLGERYKNYKDWLTDKVTNPMLSGNLPKVYVGGVNRETTAEYELRLDLIDATFYKGQTARKPDWKYNRRFTYDSVIEPEERTNNIISK